MSLPTNGCIPLFRVRGISVLLHWSWFLVAVYQITSRDERYPSLVWNVAEYLALFAIVLLHEFGHALACRQVGGVANRIVLWPLGGVAYVHPPPRPGALLWSIAAGPLVNVVLVPVTVGLHLLVPYVVPPALLAPVQKLADGILAINLVLLVFNMLPIYPLDGGQILHALLWFVMSRSTSLLVCSVLGLVGACGLLLLAGVLLLAAAQLGRPLLLASGWTAVVAVFVGLQAVGGLRQAIALMRLGPALDHIDRANAFLGKRAWADAVAACDAALESLREGQTPDGDEVWVSLLFCRAMALAEMGDHAGAIADYDEVIARRPERAGVYVNRGLSFARLGRYGLAVQDYEEALDREPRNAVALNNLAWLQATCPDPEIRHGGWAVKNARRACELDGWNQPNLLGTLAAACAEAGDFEEAVTWHKRALKDPAYRARYGENAVQRLRLYEEGRPYREVFTQS
jgi:Zn-dependent protease